MWEGDFSPGFSLQSSLAPAFLNSSLSPAFFLHCYLFPAFSLSTLHLMWLLPSVLLEPSLLHLPFPPNIPSFLPPILHHLPLFAYDLPNLQPSLSTVHLMWLLPSVLLEPSLLRLPFPPNIPSFLPPILHHLPLFAYDLPNLQPSLSTVHLMWLLPSVLLEPSLLRLPFPPNIPSFLPPILHHLPLFAYDLPIFTLLPTLSPQSTLQSSFPPFFFPGSYLYPSIFLGFHNGCHNHSSPSRSSLLSPFFSATLLSLQASTSRLLAPLFFIIKNVAPANKTP